MKLREWLKVTDAIGIRCVIWGSDDNDEALFTGFLFDIPYWIAEYKLHNPDKYEYPVSFRDDLGEKYHHKPGVVICVKTD